jgi:hypothetical protein
MDIDKGNPIKSKNWSCVKHPGCLFSIPCDCHNCIAFVKMLNRRNDNAESKELNQNQKSEIKIVDSDSRIIS